MLVYWWFLILIWACVCLKCHQKRQPSDFTSGKKVRLYDDINDKLVLATISIHHLWVWRVCWSLILEFHFYFLLSHEPRLKQRPHKAQLQRIHFHTAWPGLAWHPVPWVFVWYCHCNFYCILWCAQMCLVSIPGGRETLLNIPVPRWCYLIESLSGLPPLGCCNRVKSLDFGVLTRV